MVYYIGFHEFKHKNYYPVPFSLHRESEVKLKTDTCLIKRELFQIIYLLFWFTNPTIFHTQDFSLNYCYYVEQIWIFMIVQNQ